MLKLAYVEFRGPGDMTVPSYAPWDAEAARTIIIDRQAMPGALLPILHALQEEFGYIDREAEPLIAEALNLVARRGARRRHLLS